MTVTLSSCMDAIQVHAAAAAVAAGGATFKDVRVGFDVAKGKSVRVFYGGQRESAYFGPGVLDAQHAAESVYVRGRWPVADTGVNRQRLLEIEMGTFAVELRTRVNGDYTLGGNCTALLVLADANVSVQEVANTKYAVIDFEIGIDLGDYPQTP